MSYVFSKALSNEKAKSNFSDVPVMNSIHSPVSGKPKFDAVDKLQNELSDTNSIKPSIPEKPNIMNASRKPPVKRKPMVKSQSVDLTQVGSSEWKDFVQKRQQQMELFDPDEQQKFATVRSLNEHRNSLFDQPISEDQILKLTKLTEFNGENGIAPATLNETEPEKSVTSEGNMIPDTKLADITGTNSTDNNKDGDRLKSADGNEAYCTAAKCDELKTENEEVTNTNTTSSDQEVKDNVVNTAPVAAITLPKPRQISSELKRNAFSRNRAMSLPVAVTMQQTAFLKRSSDMFKEKAAADTKVPYFLRNSRGSGDEDSLPGISNLSVNESSDGASDNEPVFKDDERET